MEDLQKLSGTILKLLRNNPRGMSVTEISRALSLNRNSTAKYLDILLYTGRIEVRTMGRAKLFYITQRVPISALLDFSSDHILGLDGQLNIIEVNDNFLRFFGVKKEMLIDRRVNSIDLPVFNTDTQVAALQNAVKGVDGILDLEVSIGDERHYFRSKLIPTILADGKKGVTVILENVDQQVVARKMMSESEAKFRAIYESAMDAMIITDNDRLFECNDATKRMFGSSDVEFLHRKFHFFSPPLQPGGEESQKLLAKKMAQARKEGLARFDWVHRRFDGTDFQAETIITPIELYGKEALLFVIRDISERKDMEAALRDKEEMFRVLFETVPDAVLILENGRVVQCNESSLRMFGFSSRDELLGKYPWDLSPPFQPGGEVSRTKANRLLAELEEKDSMRFEWEHLRRGDPFMAEVTLVKTYLNDRPVVQGTIRDVTELRRTQQELRLNEGRLRSILSSLHGAFVGLIDENYRYEEFWGTKELDERYGISSKSLVGRSVFDFAPDDKTEELRSILGMVHSTGRVVTIDVEGILPTGTFYQEMSFSPYRMQDGIVKGIVQFAIDITEKHQVLEKLKETERLYKLLDNNVTDVIWMADREMNYTYISSSSVHLTGYEPDELIGMNIASRMTGRSLNNMMGDLGGEFRDFLDGKPRDYSPQKLELELTRKDGSTVWTEINVTTLTGPDRRPIGIIGVTREISREKEAMDELHRREAVLRTISENACSLLEDDIEKAQVQDALVKLGRESRIDRVYTVMIRDDVGGHELDFLQEWCSGDHGPWSDLIKGKEGRKLLKTFSDWLGSIRTGSPVIRSISSSTATDRKLLELAGAMTVLLVPIKGAKKVQGFMGFDDCTNERYWSNEDIEIFKAAGQVLGLGSLRTC
ncbi:MAG: PAS domain S-box protein [Thermoplasmatota archaeon]